MAARAWLDALTPAQRLQAVYPLGDDERENWHFVPKDRAGVSLRDMTAAQIEQAEALVRAGLSERGAATTEAIIGLETVLFEMSGAAYRDPKRYFFTVFGDPTPTGTWGWRLEGHHLSLNFTLVDGHPVAVTPVFMGSNPAEVRQGSAKGLRVLGPEEDLARALVTGLPPTLQAQALMAGGVPRDIVTGNQRMVVAAAPVGLSWSEFPRGAQESLQALVGHYAHRYRSEIARETLARIEETGWEQVYFAWAGGLAPGEAHYYRIQGPTFIVEYDNVQNGANHVHTVWRDFEGDFGRDLLREHHESSHP